ncbi:MAG TPA: FCD domain-containing protein [Thermomicrobiales bacterium]|nr:FCD domain-containing protein [Thermomicrobiales bacterium]
MERHSKPVLRRGLHREVVHRLGLLVLGSGAAPGATLPDETALSEQLGVSRTVVREAVKVLASKGLVESRPKVGTRICPRRYWKLLDPDVLAWRYEAGPDEGFLEEISEVRGFIEPPAAALAAERATAEEVAEIVVWCDRMEVAAADDGDDYIDADMAFHTAILDACHNDLLAQLSDTITMALRVSRRLTVSVPGSSLAAMPAHQEVTCAIRNRRPRSAERAMRELLRVTAADIECALSSAARGTT